MLININRYRLRVIVNSSTIKILISLFIANRLKFSINTKEDIYNFIIIKGNLLLSKNRKIDK